MPEALIWGEPVTVQRKWRAREKCKNKRDRAVRERREQNAMNYRKRQKRPGLAS